MDWPVLGFYQPSTWSSQCSLEWAKLGTNIWRQASYFRILKCRLLSFYFEPHINFIFVIVTEGFVRITWPYKWSCGEGLEFVWTQFVLLMIIWFTVYSKSGYGELVGDLAEDAMNHAVSEVKALPDYGEKGEVRLYYKIKHFIINFIFSLVGHYWCQAWFNSKCLSHHGPMSIRKVFSICMLK